MPAFLRMLSFHIKMNPSCSYFEDLRTVPAHQKWFIPLKFQKKKKYFTKYQFFNQLQIPPIFGDQTTWWWSSKYSFIGGVLVQCMWSKVDQTGWRLEGFLRPQFELSEGVIWVQPASGTPPSHLVPYQPTCFLSVLSFLLTLSAVSLSWRPFIDRCQ